ncbi:HIT domain-containing protein [Mesorhizobium sp. YR577]|nr:HIT domain-containing protein [Mesorhizobium sp. YR577]
MDHNCLFCRIATGEIACHTVYEDENVLAFLDIHAIRQGHTLIIPRQHYAWFEELPEALASRIMMISQPLATQMKGLYPVERVAMLLPASMCSMPMPMWFPCTISTTSRRQPTWIKGQEAFRCLLSRPLTNSRRSRTQPEGTTVR